MRRASTCAPDDAGGGARLDDVHGRGGRGLRRHEPAVRLHDEERRLTPIVREAASASVER